MTVEKKQVLREGMRSLCQKEKKVFFHATQLLALPQWQNASSILLYAPLPGEPDLLGLLEEFLEKRFFFPRIEKKKLHLYQWFPGAGWFSGSYGLQEPDPDEWSEVSIEDVDLAVIPGLAFDQAGGRLGRGGGFYDRLLSDSVWRGFKVGVAWPWQIVSSVPREPHDVLMDVVVAS
ncbi:MAG: 5-formyltetrahydrofolate cyclo-ligase [Chthoniobacterales bacterium]